MQGKRKSILFAAVVCLMLSLQAVPIFANQVLTVDTSISNEKTEVVATATPEPIKYAYPISINNEDVNGYHGIRKTYALDPTEEPTVIPTESFVQYGETFTISDIIKKEVSEDQTVDKTETITLNTATKDLNAIISQLEPEMKYDKDGYSGVLKLDLQTIHCEVAGSKTSSYTSKETREYPNLSSPDTSLVPRSVVSAGQTYTLANITWKSKSNESIDFTEIANSYTAVATYTRTGSTTKVTGYTTTAQYKGKASKTIEGKTLYTAIFLGEQILQPVIETTPEPTSTLSPEEIAATAEPTKTPILSKEASMAMLAVIGTLLALAAIGGAGFFATKKMLDYNVTVYNRHGREFKKIGKVNMNSLTDEPEIILDKLKSDSDVYIIEIAARSASRLIGKTIAIISGDQRATHVIEPAMIDGSAYQFEVDFSEIVDHEGVTLEKGTEELPEEPLE